MLTLIGEVSASYYYCYSGDAAPTGPLTEEELCQLIRTEQVRSHTQIWVEGVSTEWGPLHAFPEIAEHSPSKPSAPPCPRVRPPKEITSRALLRWAIEHHVRDEWVAVITLLPGEPIQVNIVLEKSLDLFAYSDGGTAIPMAHPSWQNTSGDYDDNDWIAVDFTDGRGVQQPPGTVALTTQEGGRTRLTSGEVLGEATPIEAVPARAYFCTPCAGWVYPRVVENSRTRQICSGNWFVPYRALTEKVQVLICSRCGARLYLSAEDFRSQLRQQADRGKGR